MIDKFYIPTLGRVENQITYNNLPDELKSKVIMVVQEDEKELYDYDVDYLVVENRIGIAKTRELICRDAGKTRFSMWDDDAVIYRRNQRYWTDYQNKPNMKKSKRKATDEDFRDMYKLFHDWMDEGILHIGHRRNNLPPGGRLPYSTNVFFNALHTINGELLTEIIDEVDWTYCEFGEDAHFMIEYLTRGYSNRRTDEFPSHWDAYQDGGCQVYRNSQNHNREHLKLEKKFPEFVSHKEMMAQGKYGKNIGVIKEFKYDMKKAFKSSTKS